MVQPPQFCKLSYVNIDEYFLKLIDRHFNEDNPSNNFFFIGTH